MESALKGGRLSLEMTGRLMEFDADGNMVVRYSEAMVTLLRDVRQLTAVGLAIPERIRAAAAEAEKYYRFGVQLQKVRRFGPAIMFRSPLTRSQ
jgi:dynein heavy chain 2, cytosolic